MLGTEGWFYEVNQDESTENACNPPWGILAKEESGLGGLLLLERRRGNHRLQREP